MTRTEMLNWVKEYVNETKQNILRMINEGVFESEDYSWQDCVFEYTGVNVDSLEAVDQLTAEELTQIIDTYI